MERLNGFFNTGYAWWSIGGNGGAVSLDLALLNALRSEANEPFLENGELDVLAVVASDECEL